MKPFTLVEKQALFTQSKINFSQIRLPGRRNSFLFYSSVKGDGGRGGVRESGRY